MTKKIPPLQAVTGVDGCKAGWIAVTLQDFSVQAETRLYSSVVDLWKEQRNEELLLIDMPIGLKSAGREERSCDKLARTMLKPGRTSSIFPAPVRAVLEAADYAEAGSLSRQLGGRGLSVQTWHLVPKIREIDNLLRSQPDAQRKFREAHPEVCFAALAGSPMIHNKKTDAGYRERMDLLLLFYPGAAKATEQAMKQFKRAEAGRDDIVDALVLAVCGLLSGDKLCPVPDPPEEDDFGIGMAIWFSKR